MTIDGINIKSKFGAYVLYGSYRSLLQYPKLKKPQKNDWAEYDGLEVDLVNPILDKKDIVLKIYCNGDAEGFVNFLMQKTYRTYEFEDLGFSFKLRFIAVADVKKWTNQRGQSVVDFKLKLSDDSGQIPKLNYSVQSSILDLGFYLDGKNFKDYGIYPKIDKEQVKTKPKLEIKSKFIKGVRVAEQVGKKKEYTATLKLFIHSNTQSFLSGYYQFLNDLIKSNERILTIQGKEYKCYYQSSKINVFDLQGSDVWCAFDVNVNII